MEQLHGTAAALWMAQDILHDRFLVLPGDDIFSAKDVERLTMAKSWALGIHKIDAGTAGEGGKVIFDARRYIEDIVEGPYGAQGGFVYCSLAQLDTRIFSSPMVRKAPRSEEFGLPQTVLAASRAHRLPLEAVELSSWIQITTPEDLVKAEQLLAG